MARVTLAELTARPAEIDPAKLDTTTEADIRWYRMEDGYDPDIEPPLGLEVILPLRTVRRRLRMTQAQIAALVGVPARTYRDWEQGRTMPDPAVRTLFKILAREPKSALRALGVAVPDAA